MKICLIVIVSFSLLATGGNWEPTGPGGAPAALIAKDIQNPLQFYVLVVYYQGINDLTCYRSNDGGLSWERVSTVSQNVSFFYSDHFSRVFCGTDETLRVSIDSGVSWTTILGTSPSIMRGVAVDPSDQNHLLVVGSFAASAPLMESFDNGQSWAEKCMSCPVDGYSAGFCSQYPETVYLAGEKPGYPDTTAVFRSNDGGSTWVDVSPDLPFFGAPWAIEIRADNPQEILMSYCSSIVKSDDGGENWTSVLTVLSSIVDMEQSSGYPEVVYASYYNRLYRSDDFGSNWVEVQLPGLMGSIHDLAASGDSLHTSCGDGHYIYSGSTGEWTPANNGIPGGMTWALHAGDGGGFPVFSSNGYWLDEDQYSWTACITPPYGGVEHVAHDAELPDTWYAAGEYG